MWCMSEEANCLMHELAELQLTWQGLSGTLKDAHELQQSDKSSLTWIRFAFLIGKLRISGKIVRHPSAAMPAW